MEYSNTQIERLINEYIHNERNRKILRLRLIDGKPYEAIAESVDMSSRQIFRIVAREEAKLYRYL